MHADVVMRYFASMFLPATPPTPYLNRVCAPCAFACSQGIASDSPLSIERLPEWLFDVRNIDILVQERSDVDSEYDSDGEEIALSYLEGYEVILQRALQQLASLRTAPGVPVRVRFMSWTEPMEQAVAQAMPTLGHLNMGVCVPLADETLGLALQMGEC